MQEKQFFLTLPTPSINGGGRTATHTHTHTHTHTQIAPGTIGFRENLSKTKCVSSLPIISVLSTVTAIN